MLVVTRRVDEVVQIGENISVMVVEIRNNQVRIGITAPDDVVIVRRELLEGEQDDRPPSA